MLIMNEKIKAAEVRLTGLDGESLGIVSREEALQMAKQLKVDLVCESLMSSPPPCKLIVRGGAKQQASQQKRAEKQQQGQPAKVKELRLGVDIEQHDYETKQRQAVKLLEAGNAVQLVIRIQGKEGARAKELLEQLLTELKPYGTKQSGIQLSGKQAAVQVSPN